MKQHRRNQQSSEVKESLNSSPAAKQWGTTDKTTGPLHPGATLSSGDWKYPAGSKPTVFGCVKGKLCHIQAIPEHFKGWQPMLQGTELVTPSRTRSQWGFHTHILVRNFIFPSGSFPSILPFQFKFPVRVPKKRPMLTPSWTSAGPVMSWGWIPASPSGNV